LLTETKSAPKNTCVTPSRPKSRSASGERVAASVSAKLAVPCSITVRPGRNLRVAGLGVVSVSMNIDCLRLLALNLANRRDNSTLYQLGSSRQAFGACSSHRGNLLLAEPARYDGDRHAQFAGARDQGRDQRSGPFLARAGTQNDDRDARLFVDQRQQFFAAAAAASQVKNGCRAADILYLARELGEELLRLLARFFLHPFLDRGELLDPGWLGYGEKRDLAAGVESAQRRIAQSNTHLIGLIDDDEKDALVRRIGAGRR